MENETPRKDIYDKLINDLQFSKILLKDLLVKREYSDESTTNVDVKIDYTMEQFDRTGDQVIIPANFTVKALDHDRQDIVIFEVSFVYELIYELDNEMDYKDNSLIDYFADNNAPMNAWPYARELVASMTTRMGLPTLNLPLLKRPSMSENQDGNSI